MAETLVCPTCRSPIPVPGDHAGAEIACPQCEKLVAVPDAREAAHVMAGEPTPMEAAPAELDEDAPPRRSFKPCPRCGAEGAKRVVFTPWGSFYGPALFNHVRCPECRYAYNGRSGGSNLIPAILFVVIPLALMVAIIAYIAITIIPRL